MDKKVVQALERKGRGLERDLQAALSLVDGPLLDTTSTTGPHHMQRLTIGVHQGFDSLPPFPPTIAICKV